MELDDSIESHDFDTVSSKGSVGSGLYCTIQVTNVHSFADSADTFFSSQTAACGCGFCKALSGRWYYISGSFHYVGALHSCVVECQAKFAGLEEMIQYNWCLFVCFLSASIS